MISSSHHHRRRRRIFLRSSPMNQLSNVFASANNIMIFWTLMLTVIISSFTDASSSTAPQWRPSTMMTGGGDNVAGAAAATKKDRRSAFLLNPHAYYPRPNIDLSDILPCDIKTEYACSQPGEHYPWQKLQSFVRDNQAMMKRMYGTDATSQSASAAERAQGPVGDAGGGGRSAFARSLNAAGGGGMSVVNACPSEQFVITPFWANNSDGETLAVVNFHPFEQAVQQEVCKSGIQGRCRDGCVCEQKFSWYRLLAFDPKDDCRGIFMDWFQFPSCCACRCYELPNNEKTAVVDRVDFGSTQQQQQTLSTTISPTTTTTTVVVPTTTASTIITTTAAPPPPSPLRDDRVPIAGAAQGTSFRTTIPTADRALLLASLNGGGGAVLGPSVADNEIARYGGGAASAQSATDALVRAGAAASAGSGPIGYAELLPRISPSPLAASTIATKKEEQQQSTTETTSPPPETTTATTAAAAPTTTFGAAADVQSSSSSSNANIEDSTATTTTTETTLSDIKSSATVGQNVTAGSSTTESAVKKAAAAHVKTETVTSSSTVTTKTTATTTTPIPISSSTRLVSVNATTMTTTTTQAAVTYTTPTPTTTSTSTPTTKTTAATKATPSSSTAFSTASNNNVTVTRKLPTTSTTTTKPSHITPTSGGVAHEDDGLVPEKISSATDKTPTKTTTSTTTTTTTATTNAGKVNEALRQLRLLRYNTILRGALPPPSNFNDLSADATAAVESEPAAPRPTLETVDSWRNRAPRYDHNLEAFPFTPLDEHRRRRRR